MKLEINTKENYGKYSSTLKHHIDQINDIIMHFNLLEKEEQAKYKSSRQKEIKKIRSERNELENKRIQRINNTELVL
jgi:hypothetical protein